MELEFEINDNGCWVCTNRVFNKRYPLMQHGDKQIPIGHYLYYQRHGKIFNGQVVRTCDNIQCINLDHFKLKEHVGGNNGKPCCLGCFNMIMMKGWKEARCSALVLNDGDPVPLEDLFKNGGCINPKCILYERVDGNFKRALYDEMKANLLGSKKCTTAA